MLLPTLSIKTMDTFPLLEGTDTLTCVPVIELIEALTKPNNTEEVLDKFSPLMVRNVLVAEAMGLKLVTLGFRYVKEPGMVMMFPTWSSKTIDTFPLFVGTDTFTKDPVRKLIDALTKPNLTNDVLERFAPDKDKDSFWAAATGVKLVATGFW